MPNLLLSNSFNESSPYLVKSSLFKEFDIPSKLIKKLSNSNSIHTFRAHIINIIEEIVIAKRLHGVFFKVVVQDVNVEKLSHEQSEQFITNECLYSYTNIYGESLHFTVQLVPKEEYEKRRRGYLLRFIKVINGYLKKNFFLPLKFLLFKNKKYKGSAIKEGYLMIL